jgi:outer membrane lipoprotein carrier protein
MMPITAAMFRPSRRLLLSFITLSLAGAVAPARAQEGGVAQLKQFVANTAQASGRFTQQAVKDGGKASRPSTGVFAYAKPGRFRWEIQKPYEQLIVTDGGELFFYDKDLQQVTVRPMTEAMNATPAALLFGTSDLDQTFRLSDDGQSDGLSWVLATPISKEAGFERVRIGLRSGVPARMEVDDAFGQRTRFDFDGIDPKAAIAADRFRFTPPAGVDVIR